MKPRCPSCHRAVLSRRTPLCGFCGASLPESILFKADQILAIEAEEAARSRAALLREEERQREAARRVQTVDSGGGFF